jgi:predicted nucleic acid-binding protein
MRPLPVVVDNDSLIQLTRLNSDIPVFDKLRSVFSSIHIPQKVIAEYEVGAAREPRRLEILQKLSNRGQYWINCTELDSFSIALVKGKKGIDEGEAEVYAQSKKIRARYILSEDKKFKKNIVDLDSTVTVISIIHLICFLDITGHIDDWENCAQKLHTLSPFNARTLRKCYTEAARISGVNVSKKQMSAKCSLKKLGVV